MGKEFFIHEKEKARTIEYGIVNGVLILVILSIAHDEGIYRAIVFAPIFFLLNLKVTWHREKRRALQQFDERKINPDIIEASFYLGGIIIFLAYNMIKDIPYSEWHPSLCFASVGLVNGSFAAEFLWRRLHLKNLTNIEIQRYWGNTSRTIILPSSLFD